MLRGPDSQCNLRVPREIGCSGKKVGFELGLEMEQEGLIKVDVCTGERYRKDVQNVLCLTN